MDTKTLTIGQFAQRFGLKTSAIRYYEANGILPEPARRNGQRRYGPEAVRRMEILDVAKRAGFSLDEARVLLRSADAGTPAFESLRELAMALATHNERHDPNRIHQPEPDPPLPRRRARHRPGRARAPAAPTTPDARPQPRRPGHPPLAPARCSAGAQG